MPIDPSSEPVHSLSALARGRVGWFVNPRTGRPFSFSSINRFRRHGVRGVRLETVRLGDVVCSTESALKAFVDRVSVADIRPPREQFRSPAAPADRFLDSVGI